MDTFTGIFLYAVLNSAALCGRHKSLNLLHNLWYVIWTWCGSCLFGSMTSPRDRYRFNEVRVGQKKEWQPSFIYCINTKLASNLVQIHCNPPIHPWHKNLMISRHKLSSVPGLTYVFFFFFGRASRLLLKCLKLTA